MEVSCDRVRNSPELSVKRGREGLCLALARNFLTALTGHVGVSVAPTGRVQDTLYESDFEALIVKVRDRLWSLTSLLSRCCLGE